jgi:hypothetical protein
MPIEASCSPPTDSRGSTVGRGTGSVGVLGVGLGVAATGAALEAAGEATAPPTARRRLAAAAVR